MDVVWDGITQSRTLFPEQAQLRHELANLAKSYSWDRVLHLLEEHPDLVNTTRPDGASLYSPLHQAAYGGAPLPVVERLLALGAFRSIRNATSERPCDVARMKGHAELGELLKPAPRHEVDLDQLARLQTEFHKVINGRAEREVQAEQLRLPELEVLLEWDPPKMWFAVPGMYGGFNYWLSRPGLDHVLVTESWCRIAGGSGQRHEITPEGSVLVEEGFV